MIMKKNKQRKTIIPIEDNSSSGKNKRLPKKPEVGDYYVKSVSKFHK